MAAPWIKRFRPLEDRVATFADLVFLFFGIYLFRDVLTTRRRNHLSRAVSRKTQRIAIRGDSIDGLLYRAGYFCHLAESRPGLFVARAFFCISQDTQCFFYTASA